MYERLVDDLSKIGKPSISILAEHYCKIILCGNLTKDPDVRYTQSGKKAARMPSAINSYGENFGCRLFTLWRGRKPPNASGKYLAKGSKVLVEGRLKNNNYKVGKGAVAENLAKGDAVAIRDFGVFKIIQRKERKGRNPRTGEEITIAAHKKAIFKQGKAVKEKVNVL